MATASDLAKSNRPALVVILILEILSLFPWWVFAALSAMGFDSGFSWDVVLYVAPIWAYPLLILLCSPVAFVLNTKGKVNAAVIVILLPPLISIVLPISAVVLLHAIF